MKRSEAPLRLGVILKLGRRYLRNRPTLVVAYVLGALATVTALPVAVAITYSEITNYFQSSSRPGMAPGVEGAAGGRALLDTYWLWVALVLGGVLALFGQRYLTAYFDGTVANAIRSDVFANLLRQSPRFFHKNTSDQLTLVVNQLCLQAQMALRQLLIDPLVQLVGIGVVGVTLYDRLSELSAQRGAQIWGLFLVVAAFALISPALVQLVARRLRRDASAVQQQNLASATLVGGALAAPEEIQAMRAEPFFTKQYQDLLAVSLRLRLRQSVTVEQLNALNVLPGEAVLVGLIGLAIYLAITGASGLEPSTIVAVGLLTPQLMSGVQSLSSFTINASLAWPALETVDEILGDAPEVVSSSGVKPIDRIEPVIEAREVAFSYRPGELGNVLDGVSFRIPPGMVTGLIARPGRGKTTFFRLALRFYEPQGGQILLGNLPVASLPLESLRRHIGLMSQFPAFFYGTTRENFQVAKPGATDDELREVCETTGLWPILESTFGPDPLDQEFAAGKLLSGGQKKLFALTRMLLQEPTVLLLDEPTVGMGPLEKFPLIGTMRRACAGKTVVAVDHDIVWQVRFCDQFLVLDEGKIVQQGTGEELLARPGLFQELYEEATRRGPEPAGATQAGAPVPSPAPEMRGMPITGVAPGTM